MIWIFHLVLLFLVSGLAHFASLLAYPTLTKQDAFSRILVHAPENNMAPIPEHVIRDLPFFDPYIRLAACRYNLALGPVRIRAPLSDTYSAIILIEPGRSIYSSISDRAAMQGAVDVVLATKPQLKRIEALSVEDEAIDEVRIQATNPTGLALIKVLMDRPSTLSHVEETLARSTCTSERL